MPGRHRRLGAMKVQLLPADTADLLVGPQRTGCDSIACAFFHHVAAPRVEPTTGRELVECRNSTANGRQRPPFQVRSGPGLKESFYVWMARPAQNLVRRAT